MNIYYLLSDNGRVSQLNFDRGTGKFWEGRVLLRCSRLVKLEYNGRLLWSPGDRKVSVVLRKYKNIAGPRPSYSYQEVIVNYQFLQIQ